jgi:hypothetical protein
MNLNEEFDGLENYFGKSNIKIEYFFDPQLEILHPKQYSKIKLTHKPSKKVILGESYATQIENAVDALKKLKSLLTE